MATELAQQVNYIVDGLSKFSQLLVQWSEKVPVCVEYYGCTIAHRCPITRPIMGMCGSMAVPCLKMYEENGPTI